MKQARAFGVGVVVATQNQWTSTTARSATRSSGASDGCKTDADRARVLDGLAASVDASREDAAEVGRTVQRLGNRWFVVRNSHAQSGPVLLNPRYAMSWMRGR